METSGGHLPVFPLVLGNTVYADQGRDQLETKFRS